MLGQIIKIFTLNIIKHYIKMKPHLQLHFRLANIHHLTNFSEDNIMYAARKFGPFIDGLHNKGGFSCSVDVVNQVTGVEKKLRFEATNKIIANISKASLKAAENTFIFINPNTYPYNCPFLDFNKWYGLWSPFYDHLLKTQSADKIILTLNRIIKTTSDQLSINAAKGILTRAASFFSLNYEDIQSRLSKKSLNLTINGDSRILEKVEGTLLS